MENSESDGVGRARRLRAVLPTRRRAATPVATPDAVPEGPAIAESMTERGLRRVAAYIGDYPADEAERVRCNQALRQLLDPPLEQAG